MQVAMTPVYLAMCQFSLFVALRDYNPQTLQTDRQRSSRSMRATCHAIEQHVTLETNCRMCHKSATFASRCGSRSTERRRKYSVWCLCNLSLWRDASKVTLVQRSIEAALQRRINVRQCHNVLRFLFTHNHNMLRILVFYDFAHLQLSIKMSLLI